MVRLDDFEPTELPFLSLQIPMPLIGVPPQVAVHSGPELLAVVDVQVELCVNFTHFTTATAGATITQNTATPAIKIFNFIFKPLFFLNKKTTKYIVGQEFIYRRNIKTGAFTRAARFLIFRR